MTLLMTTCACRSSVPAGDAAAKNRHHQCAPGVKLGYHASQRVGASLRSASALGSSARRLEVSSAKHQPTS